MNACRLGTQALRKTIVLPGQKVGATRQQYRYDAEYDDRRDKA